MLDSSLVSLVDGMLQYQICCWSMTVRHCIFIDDMQKEDNALLASCMYGMSICSCWLEQSQTAVTAMLAEPCS